VKRITSIIGQTSKIAVEQQSNSTLAVAALPFSSCGSHGSRVVCSCHRSGGHSSVCRSSSGNSSSSGSSAAVTFQRMMNWTEQISMQDALAAKSKELIIARAATAGEDVTFE
jgi:hypothetical protein